MPFNVDEFRASLGLRGTLKTTKFQVTFPLPPCFDGDPDRSSYLALCQDAGLWCDSTSIPGVVMQTLKFRRYGYGSLDTAPVSVNFNDVQLRFIIDGNGDNWRMFHKWINKGINSDSSKGMWNGTTEVSAGKPIWPYETAFQGDFETDIILTVYDDAGNEVKNIYLNQAIPTAMSEVKLDWGDNGDVARFVVNVAIQDWFSTEVSTTSIGPNIVQN